MSDFNSDALIGFREQLKNHILVNVTLTDILEVPAGGFMTTAEAQSVRNNAESQMGRLIEILLGKGDKEFDIFCEMLRRSNYPAWAHALEQKAKALKKGEKCSIVASYAELQLLQVTEFVTVPCNMYI